ncbi:hypothetical protein AB0N38_26340 [Micromonospora aurantiaca]|uniref:hypothetical protein n=1 Tax=Micromonospora aurantiaca (nom. illeg.) TaxID=47850 RepID=UPI003415E550
MTQPTPPYTADDIQLIVVATEQHSLSPGQPDADGHDPCSCGQWREGADGSSWDEHMAEVSLAALAAAGRLLPADASTEWTWKHNNYVSTASATTDREEAERAVWRCRTANPGDPVRLMRRTVTDWTPAGVKP